MGIYLKTGAQKFLHFCHHCLGLENIEQETKGSGEISKGSQKAGEVFVILIRAAVKLLACVLTSWSCGVVRLCAWGVAAGGCELCAGGCD